MKDHRFRPATILALITAAFAAASCSHSSTDVWNGYM